MTKAKEVGRGEKFIFSASWNLHGFSTLSSVGKLLSSCSENLSTTRMLTTYKIDWWSFNPVLLPLGLNSQWARTKTVQTTSTKWPAREDLASCSAVSVVIICFAVLRLFSLLLSTLLLWLCTKEYWWLGEYFMEVVSFEDMSLCLCLYNTFLDVILY